MNNIKRRYYITAFFIVSFTVLCYFTFKYNSNNVEIPDETTPLGFSSIVEQKDYIDQVGDSIKTGNSIIDSKIENTLWTNVMSFGAKGDGQSDDTKYIQNAIDDAAKSDGVVFIPQGNYMINAEKSLQIKNKITIVLDKAAVLKAIPTFSNNYTIIYIADTSDVAIIGGILEGERDRHLGFTGQWGMGVRVIGANNVLIKNVSANKCWGDGFYIGSSLRQKYSQNVTLVDVSANNNRRQGISLISGRNIQIIRPKLTNTNGTAPSAGIDIEPNNKDEYLENIKIDQPYTENNATGILIGAHNLDESNREISVDIIGHRDYQSKIGIDVYCNATTLKGYLNIIEPTLSQNKEIGLLITCHNYDSFKIQLEKPHVIDANTVGDREIRASALVISSYATRQIRSYLSGNITINNPIIEETRIPAKLIYGINFRNSNVPYKKIDIINANIKGISINENKLIIPKLISDSTFSFVSGNQVVTAFSHQSN